MNSIKTMTIKSASYRNLMVIPFLINPWNENNGACSIVQ